MGVEELNEGGEPRKITPQEFAETVLRIDDNLSRIADGMDEVADFFEALDRVLSQDRFRTEASGGKLERMTVQRFIDAYNEACEEVDAERGEDPDGEADNPQA